MFGFQFSHHWGNGKNQRGLTKRPHKWGQHIVLGCVCSAFFGFLRCGEFTVPSQSEYDPSTHLSLDDITIDSADSPSLIQVSIKQSKTDPFHKGVQLFLAKTGKNICPITAIMPYLALRGPKQAHYSITKEETISHDKVLPPCYAQLFGKQA